MSGGEHGPSGEKVSVASALGIFFLTLLELCTLSFADKVGKYFENSGNLLPSGSSAH